MCKLRGEICLSFVFEYSAVDVYHCRDGGISALAAGYIGRAALKKGRKCTHLAAVRAGLFNDCSGEIHVPVKCRAAPNVIGGEDGHAEKTECCCKEECTGQAFHRYHKSFRWSFLHYTANAFKCQTFLAKYRLHGNIFMIYYEK